MHQHGQRPQDHAFQKAQGEPRYGSIHGTQGRAEYAEYDEGYPYQRAVGRAQAHS